MSERKRCKWCNLKNTVYIKYHDEEWGVPNFDEQYLFEMLILESFQAGLSWECVLNKREDFRKAFDDFDAEKIANYDDDKIATILWKYKSSLAMACNEVYAKAGAEGQTEHRESDVSRSYKSAWISSDLVNALPNYVGFF